MTAPVDVLIPTRDRPTALAVTLAALGGQTLTDFRVVVADQSDDVPSFEGTEAAAAIGALRAAGRTVDAHQNLPRRGMAQQRQFLLERATAPYVLFLDDDVLLAPDVLERLVRALEDEGCGFAGCGLIGLSYERDVRPQEQRVELWDGRVRPERVRPGSPEWERHRLHNAANVLHAQRRLGPGQHRYKVAWIGGCVLYDAEKLRACGGFSFWQELPGEHAGEDVLAQLRVMERYGGFGLLPSGAFHLELPTTIAARGANAVTLAA